uniref:CCHC-type domain-containing protein n=1 Tax=Tanacetum cinerariifolium TaxID=118510 RepID=A0A699GNW9_TANCI|nr:hypothetical protein [Tanacetum cinerariifolium]
MSANDKFRLGYGDYRYGSILSYKNEVLQSVFINKESDMEDTPVNDRYAEGMHDVSPPMIRNYIPSGPDVEIYFKEYTLRDYYCWLKTYCYWYKLKLLDNAADSRLRLLEQIQIVSAVQIVKTVSIRVNTVMYKLARKNELKARGTLLMALSDKHRLKFNIHKDAKTLMEVIEKRFGGNKETKKVQKTLLKQQYENFTGSNLEDQSLDDLFNSLKIYEAEVKSSSTASPTTQNIDFLSSQNTDSTNESVSAAASVSTASIKVLVYALPNADTLSDVVIYSFFASQSNISQLNNDDLKQIDADDIEEMDLKWQMAMLTMRARRFLQRTEMNFGENRTTSIRVDMSKCDGVGSYDWSFQAEEEPTNYALMAFTSSSSSSSDNELRDNALVDLKKKFKKAEQERDELKLKLDKFQTSSKNLSQPSESDVSMHASPVYDRYNSGVGYHVIPPPYTGTFLPPKPNLVFHDAPTVNETDPSVFNVELKPTKSAKDLSQSNRPSAPLIEDWVSNSEDDSKGKPKNTQIVPSFVQPTKHVKTPRPSVKTVEHPIPAANLKTEISKPKGYGNNRNRKACFVCKSLTHLIKDCDYYAKKMVPTPVRNHAQRGNHQHYARMTLPNPQRHVVPTTVLTRSRLVPFSTARPVNTVVPYNNVIRPRPAKNVSTKPLSPPTRTINHRPSPSASNFHQKVTIAKAPQVHAVNGVQRNWAWKPKCPILDHVSQHISASITIKKFDYTDALERSKHMTGNMSYLADFEEINGGYIDFGGNLKGGKITGKGKNQERTEYIVLSPEFKLPDENQVLLRVPRENNMYNVDLKNIVPSRDLTCKFDGKAGERFLVGYSISRNQPNPSACIQEYFDADKVGEGIVQQYVPFPLWSSGFKDPQNTNDDVTFEVKEPEFEVEKPESEVYVSPSSSTKTKKHDDKTRREAKGKSPVELSTGFRNLSEEFKDFSDNSISEVNAVSTPVPAVGQISINSTNTFSAAGPSNSAVSPTHGKSLYVDHSQYPDDPNMLALEDITYSDDEKAVGAEADFPNFKTTITVSLIPTTRVHKDHPVTQIIGDFSLSTQTRSMTRMVKDQGGLTQINNKDFHTCMFACFLSQKEPKRAQNGFFRNKKDERGIVVKNKARLVGQGHTQEDGIDYEEVFAPVARIKAIRLFLAYASFMGFMVYQMDVKSAFLYETIEEEVYVCQPPGFEDPDYPNKVYKVVKTLYGLHQAPRACKDLCKAFEKLMKDKFQMSSMGELTFFLGLQVKQKQDGIFISQDKYVAKILRKFGLTDGKSASTSIDTEKPLLKDPDGEDMDVHTHSDYAGASLDRKFTKGGCQFFGCRLISWQCKKQTVVATLSTEAEYIAVANGIEVFAIDLKVTAVRLIVTAVNDVIRLQALIDRKKVFITEDTVHQALRLDDAESINYLSNEEIFAELARMGYEKPSTKLIFYKAFFLALVGNVDSSSKFCMYPRFLQLMIAAQVGDLTSHTTKYASLALTQKVFANMRRVGKRFYRVNTPLFKGMLVQQEAADDVDDVVANNVPANDVADDVIADDVADVVAHAAAEPTQPRVENLEQDKIAQALEIIKLKQRVKKLEKKNKLKVSGLTRLRKVGTTQRVESSTDTIEDDQEDASKQGGIITLIDADEDVTLEEVNADKDAKVVEDAAVQGRLEESQAQFYHINLEHADKVLTNDRSSYYTATIIIVAAAFITAAPSAAKRRKGVVIRDPEETATPSTIVHFEPKSKDKGKGTLVEEPKPLKKQAHIEQDEAYARELEAELNKNINYDDVIEHVKRKEKEDNVVLRPIFEKYVNSNVAFLEKSEKELEEEASRALKRKTTPLALNVPVVDYQIHIENNKPHYKIIRADGTHQLFLSFLSLLRNFDREDLEVLWQIVQEIFASLKPNNFSNDFLLAPLKAMFKKSDVKAQVWKNQRGIHGLAKVKSWRLLESCRVHIITFTTTQMILLVERRYPLIRFTLDQMLNNVRLEVKEESEVSLELLRFIRRQHFGVDIVEDFKEYTLRDYYSWLKTYCCWYKLKLLDNAADSRLRLLEQIQKVNVVQIVKTVSIRVNTVMYKHTTSMPEPVKSKPKIVCEPKVSNDAPIIEKYESDSDDDSVSNVQEDKEKPSFAFTDSVKHVKTSRENVKATSTPNHSPKVEKLDRNGTTRKGLVYAFTRKTCFVCNSFSHLIRDCDFYEKRLAKQAELTKSKNKVTGQRDNM